MLRWQRGREDQGYSPCGRGEGEKEVNQELTLRVRNSQANKIIEVWVDEDNDGSINIHVGGSDEEGDYVESVVLCINPGGTFSRVEVDQDLENLGFQITKEGYLQKGDDL